MLQQRLVVINSLISSSVRNRLLKDGLQLFQQALQEGLAPDKVTFLSVLSALAGQTSLMEAKWMHTYIITSSYESDIMVGTSLIHMYGKYHCLDRARNMFETMHEKNEVTWNAMITALARNKQSESVLLFFAHMECEGVLPTRITYIVVINVCTNVLDFAEGMRMHARIFAAGFAADVVMESALITFYGKYGSFSSAEAIFNQNLEPNVVAWTALMTVYAENGKDNEVFPLLVRMQQQKVVPNAVTFISLVDVCTRQGALLMGMHLHTFILTFGFDVVLEVSNTLIHFYRKCGKLEVSWQIFSGMPEKDVISWNGMISVCVCKGDSSGAIDLFCKMLQNNVVPTKATFIGMLDAYAMLHMPSEAHKVYFCIVQAFFESDPILINALMGLYGSCDSLADVRVIFDKVAVKSDVVAWNALLGACVQCEKGDDALALFGQMLVEGVVPNNVTYISAFSACACFRRVLLKEGRKLHACCCVVSSGVLLDVVAYNSLLNMYSKWNSISEAHTVFINMSEHNEISYNILMAGCAEDCHEAKIVRQKFSEMLEVGLLPDEVSFVSILKAFANQGCLREVKLTHVRILLTDNEHNPVLWNALVDVYGKCDCIDGALKVFEEIREPDVVTWNALIAASVESNLAFVLLTHMQEQGILPDEATFISIVAACATQVTLALASRMHARIVHELRTSPNIALSTALVKMHGSCEWVELAWITFRTMPERNLISWNAILAVYAHAGEAAKSLDLFQHMQQKGIAFDEVTVIGILSACSHDGLVDEAVHVFSCVEYIYGLYLVKDHYSCMIDAFGRAGQLEKAEFLLKSIPLAERTSIPAEMTLLSTCRIHGDSQRGSKVLAWILRR